MLQNHACITDSLRVQDKTVHFNVKVWKFIDTASDSVLQLLGNYHSQVLVMYQWRMITIMGKCY